MPRWSKTYTCRVVPAKYTVSSAAAGAGTVDASGSLPSRFHVTRDQLRTLAWQLSEEQPPVCSEHDLGFQGGQVTRAWTTGDGELWAEFQLDLDTAGGAAIATQIGNREAICVSLSHHSSAIGKADATVTARELTVCTDPERAGAYIINASKYKAKSSEQDPAAPSAPSPPETVEVGPVPGFIGALARASVGHTEPTPAPPPPVPEPMSAPAQPETKKASEVPPVAVTATTITTPTPAPSPSPVPMDATPTPVPTPAAAPAVAPEPMQTDSGGGAAGAADAAAASSTDRPIKKSAPHPVAKDAAAMETDEPAAPSGGTKRSAGAETIQERIHQKLVLRAHLRQVLTDATGAGVITPDTAAQLLAEADEAHFTTSALGARIKWLKDRIPATYNPFKAPPPAAAPAAAAAPAPVPAPVSMPTPTPVPVLVNAGAPPQHRPRPAPVPTIPSQQPQQRYLSPGEQLMQMLERKAREKDIYASTPQLGTIPLFPPEMFSAITAAPGVVNASKGGASANLSGAYYSEISKAVFDRLCMAGGMQGDAVRTTAVHDSPVPENRRNVYYTDLASFPKIHYGNPSAM